MKMVYANLDSLIVKKAVPEQAKLDILRQVAKGLKFLHVELSALKIYQKI